MDTLGTLGTLTGMLGAPIVNKVKDAFIQDEPTNAADEIIQSFVNDSPAFQTKKFASKGANNKWVVSKVDSKDGGTPDVWVQRHPDLVRLTGRHPFNCEAPLELLMEAGFITPTSVHYVRNHGAVPQLRWGTHTVTVEGGPRKHIWSMQQIANMPRRSIPVTLVCAGNRRKEMNMLKQTIGFNWGAAGVSTSVWTGVPLHIFLKRCGVTKTSPTRQHVRFRGPLGELPAGSDGSYGTSIPLEMALNPASDCMIAYEQNGQKLHPDHGYPVRLIVPGWIGGRMIKWLCHVEVTAEPSDNHYHFHDNRILPPHVDAETAKAEGWWFKPDYIFNELNVNSAISSPKHDESVEYDPARPEDTYTIKGYCYTGGGRRLTRAEVSLDAGTTWRLCTLNRPEHPTCYGRHWCWAFWSYEVPRKELAGAAQLCCRAWDESNNTQPRDLTWNVMGMGNNCCFRLKAQVTQAEDGCQYILYTQPTQPGPLQGGWMGHVSGGWKPSTAILPMPAPVPLQKTVVPAISPITAQASSETAVVAVKGFKPGGGRIISMAEVEEHDLDDDCWIVVNGKVYDPTKYLPDHPGGGSSITINAGTDTTEEFEAIHSKKAWGLLDQWYIGDLEGAAEGTPQVVSDTMRAPAAQPTKTITVGSGPTRALDGKNETELALKDRNGSGPKHALDGKKKVAFALKERIEVNHNTRVFRFALQSDEHIFGLPVGQHVLISAKIDDKLVVRAYTPKGDGPGYFDLLIKVYFKNVHPRFPDGGVFSQHLESLNIGDTVDVKGPIGHVLYEGKGSYKVEKQQFHCTKLGMMAGGTGITPMWQVICDICKNPDDNTEVYLIFANNSWDDLMLYDELNELEQKHPQLHVWHTLATPPADGSWRYSEGFINEEMCRSHLPSPGDDTSIFLCGPPPMLKFACYPALEALGHRSERIVAF